MKHTCLFLFAVFICLLPAGCVEEPVIKDGLIGAREPVVTTHTPGTATATSVTVSGEVERENGSPVEERGFRWKTETEEDYAEANHTIATGKGKGDFSVTVENLKHDMGYYIQAYARNEAGTGYGEEKPFTTRSGLGAVETLEALQIKAEWAVAGGKIISPGESEIIQRGVYYSTSPLVPVSAAKDSVISEMKTDSFTCVIKGLERETLYYVQAFAINRFGTVVGAQKQFSTTHGRPLLDNITADPKYARVDLTAVVTSEGDSSVTERGFCYVVEGDPTIENDTIHCGSGGGDFQGVLTNLIEQQQYHVRAYAINVYGVAYSETATFTYAGESPIIWTRPIVIEEKGTLHVRGEISDEGLTSVTESGICWATHSVPEVEKDNSVSLSLGISAFETVLSNIRGGETYYVRAYARTGMGIRYGMEVSIKTPPVIEPAASFEGALSIPGSAAYFVMKDRGYLLGGDTGSSPTDELWTFNPSNNTWGSLSPCPVKRRLAAVAHTEDVAIVFGGLDENGGAVNDLYHYTVDNNLWMKMQADEGDGPGSMYAVAGCYSDSSAYFIGGTRRDTKTNVDIVTDEVWKYHPFSQVWQKKSVPFPERQFGGVALVVNDTIYAGLGASLDGFSSFSHKFRWSADGADTWQEGPDIPSAYQVKAGVVYKHAIYVADSEGSLWRFDTRTNTWEEKCRLPAQYKEIHCMYRIGDNIYIGLGYGADALIRYDFLWDN
jgi:N-acetylneuraminic acid mutarotase